MQNRSSKTRQTIAGNSCPELKEFIPSDVVYVILAELLLGSLQFHIRVWHS